MSFSPSVFKFADKMTNRYDTTADHYNKFL